MSQAAFLSALAGVEVSEAAAQAAISALYDIDGEAQRGKFQSQAHPLKQQGTDYLLVIFFMLILLVVFYVPFSGSQLLFWRAFCSIRTRIIPP